MDKQSLALSTDDSNQAVTDLLDTRLASLASSVILILAMVGLAVVIISDMRNEKSYTNEMQRRWGIGR